MGESLCPECYGLINIGGSYQIATTAGSYFSNIPAVSYNPTLSGQVINQVTSQVHYADDYFRLLAGLPGPGVGAQPGSTSVTNPLTDAKGNPVPFISFNVTSAADEKAILSNLLRQLSGGGDSGYGGYNGVGNPINSATGNKYETLTLYVGAGSFPLVARLTYNSLDAGLGTQAMPYGSNWRGSYNRSIAVVPDQPTPTVRVSRSDGKSYVYTQTANGWTPSPDVVATLMSNSASGWTLTLPSGMVEAYDANGNLQSLSDRNGRTQVLTYDAIGRLSAVFDPAGRALTYSYDGQNRVTSIADPGARLTTITYDSNNNLSTVTYPDGGRRAYVYEDSRFPHAMTGLFDETGSRYASWTYDDAGRALTSQLAGGASGVTLTYNTGSTTVTDALGV
ncbi:MAG: DUF6531 domain-containing protein, partial [Pseudonocardiaceae bacterium]